MSTSCRVNRVEYCILHCASNTKCELMYKNVFSSISVIMYCVIRLSETSLKTKIRNTKNQCVLVVLFQNAEQCENVWCAIFFIVEAFLSVHFLEYDQHCYKKNAL